MDRIERIELKLRPIKDEENSLATKLSLFVISESMLIISFVTSLTLGVENRIVPVILEAIGVSVTFLFLLTVISQGRYITKLQEDFKTYFSDIKFHLFSYSFIGAILMFTFLIMWILFLIYIP